MQRRSCSCRNRCPAYPSYLYVYPYIYIYTAYMYICCVFFARVELQLSNLQTIQLWGEVQSSRNPLPVGRLGLSSAGWNDFSEQETFFLAEALPFFVNLKFIDFNHCATQTAPTAVLLRSWGTPRNWKNDDYYSGWLLGRPVCACLYNSLSLSLYTYYIDHIR